MTAHDDSSPGSPDDYRAFWSYVHSDDDDEGGRISELSRLVSQQVRLLTGSSFPVFLDHDGIEWGNDWEMTIDEALESTKFFIPIITPSYFKSKACRAELVKFVNSAKSLGLEELILPIYYVAVPDFRPDMVSTDELVELVKSLQYENWREIALEDPSASVHRKGVRRLAEALQKRSASADNKPSGGSGPTLTVLAKSLASGQSDPGGPPNPVVGADQEEEEDEEDGVLDVLAAGQAALVRVGESMARLTALTDIVGKAATDGVARIEMADNSGKGFAGRLEAARQYAKDVEGPAIETNELAAAFLRDLLEVDPMVRLLAEFVTEGNIEREDAREVFDSIRQMVVAADQGLGAAQIFADSVVEGTKWSKDMRKATRPLVEGLRQIADAREIFHSWLPLIDLGESSGHLPPGEPAESEPER